MLCRHLTVTSTKMRVESLAEQTRGWRLNSDRLWVTVLGVRVLGLGFLPPYSPPQRCHQPQFQERRSHTSIKRFPDRGTQRTTWLLTPAQEMETQRCRHRRRLPPGGIVGPTPIPKCGPLNLASPGGYRAPRKIVPPWLEKHLPGASQVATRAPHTSASVSLSGSSFLRCVRVSVVFVSVHHGVPWPGPEGAEGDGAAHRILRAELGPGGPG